MIHIDGNSLTIEQVHGVAREREPVAIAPHAVKAVEDCRNMLQELVDSGQPIYGVTTGIGEFARISVSKELGEELQKRIVYSHSAGVGDFFEPDEVRGGMLLRANTLAKGYSAVRLSTVNTLIEMLNRGVVPAVNSQGSVGTSGDLSPLSQMAEVVMGEGRAFYNGELMPGGKAMQLAGIEPVRLSFKEGLGLINGPQLFTGCGALYLRDAIPVVKSAMIASAMTIDALRSPLSPYDARVHAVRPLNGQNVVAANIRRLIADSEILDTAAREGKFKVQDAYSLRCVPQVYGPTVDALQYVRGQLETEMNSACDNPLFFPKDRKQLAAGNFHGQPTALALDFFCIAMSEIGGLSERHTNRLLNPALSGLPDFLVEGKGLNSGLMVAHYTAAALCSENKLNSHPAVVDNFSLAADQEDHVNMGPLCAKKLKRIVGNDVYILAIEMMCAAQAFDFRKERPGKGTAVAYRLIREVVPHLENDRILYPDIQAIAELVRSRKILDAVEKEVGRLDLEWEGRPDAVTSPTG